MDLFKLAGNIVVNGKEAVADLKKIEDQGQKTANKIQKKFRSGMKKVGKWAKRGAAVGGTAMAALAANGIKEFASFEKGMKEVFTLIPEASEEMREDMTEDIKEIGEEYGYVSEKTIPALYQAISAGIPRDNVMTFMEQAAKSAKAGATDLQTSVDTLTSVVNAYGSEVIKADEASDILFTTVKEGKVTFPELGSSIANVTPIASALGVQFEDLGASIATMTKQGMDSSKTTNYLRRLLQELSTAGMDAFEVFEKAAGETFPEFIKNGGRLNEALQIMHDYAQKNGKSMTDLFGRVQAGQAAMMLTGSSMEEFTENIEAMGESSGATETAFQEMASGIQHTIDQIKSWWNNTNINIGESLKEPLQDLLSWLQSNSDEIQSKLTEVFVKFVDSLKWINNNGKKTRGIIEGIGAALAGWKIAGLVSSLWGLVAVLGVIGGLGIAKAVNKIADAFGETKTKIDQHRENAENAAEATNDLEEAESKLEKTLDRLQKKYDELEDKQSNQAKALKSSIESVKRQIESKKSQKEWTEKVKKAEEEAAEQTKIANERGKGLAGTNKILSASLGDVKKHLDKEEASLKDLKSRLGEYMQLTDETTESLDEEKASLDEVRKRLEKNTQATTEAKGEHVKLNKVRQKVAKRLDEIQEKEEYLGEAFDENKAKTQLYKDALGMLKEAGIDPNSEAAQEFRDNLDNLRESTEDTEDSTDDLSKSESKLGKQLALVDKKAKVFGDEIDVHAEKARILKNRILELMQAEGDHSEKIAKLTKSYKKHKKAVGGAEKAYMQFADSALDALDNVLNKGQSVSEGISNAFSLENIGGAIGELFGMGDLGSLVGKGVGIVWDWLFGPSKKQKWINKTSKSLKDSLTGSLKSAFDADNYQDFAKNFGKSVEDAVKGALIRAFIARGAMKDKIDALSNYMAKAVADSELTGQEKDKIRSMYESIVDKTKPLFEMISDFSLTGEDKAKKLTLPAGVRTMLSQLRASFNQASSANSPSGSQVTSSERTQVRSYLEALSSQPNVNIDLSDIKIQSEQDIDDLVSKIYQQFKNKQEGQGKVRPMPITG